MANCAFLKNGNGERWLWKKITKKEEKKRRKKVSGGDRLVMLKIMNREDGGEFEWVSRDKCKQCFLRVRFLETAPYSRTATHHAIPYTIYGGEQAHA